MEWSWTTWMVSVGAVGASAAVAWLEGTWTTRPGLTMGFRQHAGMWGDAWLLSAANALMVPHVPAGPWIGPAALAAGATAVAVHVFWYRAAGLKSRATTAATTREVAGLTSRGTTAASEVAVAGATEHMWPSRRRGTWHGDLSWAGWLHVAYVAAELTLLLGFAVHPMPHSVVIAVVVLFSIHVPLGLLQPHWVLSGHHHRRDHRLLASCLALLWIVAWVKW